MNSRKTNLRLIENITVQVPNTASVTKGILFHVSKFLEKMIFQLMSEIIKWIRQLQVCQQTAPNYWCRNDKCFWPEHVFLKGCFSFKTEDLVFAGFLPDCLYISWKYRAQASLKNLKALEQRYWLNLSETGNQLTFSKSFTLIWLLLSSFFMGAFSNYWKFCDCFLILHVFPFNKKIFYKKMSLKYPKTLRKC